VALCTVRNTQTFKTEDQHMGDIEMPPESEKQTGSKELDVLLAEARREAEEHRVRVFGMLR
jgi:hypothetical protein